jgi:hypothetical protein
MLNALRALRDDRRHAPVRPWLFRIAHNESVSVLRRRVDAEPLDPERVETGDVHRTAEEREELQALLADVGALTDHQRAALLLRELAGLGYDEVATVLETTPLAARQAVFAARASLHEQRAGRELPCTAVQRRLSDGDRRAARTRAVRAHLRGCDDCRGFAGAMSRRRRAAALLPVPSLAGGGLLASILDAAGGPAAGGGSAVATGVVAKAAVALTAAVVATNAAPSGREALRRAPAANAPTTASAPARATAPRAHPTTAPAAAHATPGVRPVALHAAQPAATRTRPAVRTIATRNATGQTPRVASTPARRTVGDGGRERVAAAYPSRAEVGTAHVHGPCADRHDAPSTSLASEQQEISAPPTQGVRHLESGGLRSGAHAEPDRGRAGAVEQPVAVAAASVPEPPAPQPTPAPSSPAPPQPQPEPAPQA